MAGPDDGDRVRTCRPARARAQWGVARVRLSARGTASPAVAWERYADVRRWPEWSPQIRRVEASTPRIQAGATGVVHSVAGLRVWFVVEDVDEDARVWSWRVRVGPVGLHLTHAVTPWAGGCATQLTIDGPAVVATAYAPVARLALSRLVRS